MTDATETTNPYVGPRAFLTGEKLYGRDRERRDLLDLLIARRIVLLHSPSGAGKSSLINAGLIPPLKEEEGFRVLPTARVNLDPWAALGLNRSDPLPARDGRPFNRYIFSLLLSFEENLPPEQRTPPPELACQGLETYLTCCPDPDGPREDLVLIFDQFEEIITVDSTDREGKLAFFAELGEVLGNRRRWALFAMREDYMPALDPYLRLIPTRLGTTFRLDLLGREAARQAIQNPAESRGVTFAREAADRLIDDLSTVQVQQPDGTWKQQPGLYVEPVQLQVVCSQLWDRLDLHNGKREITLDDLAALGGMGNSLVDQSLAEYYASRVQKVAGDTGVSERAIREWVEHELITEGGVRGLVLMAKDASKGLKNEAIWGLVGAHLVRSEKRAGATWYELAHDRLIGPARESNAQWRAKHLSLLQRQAGLWQNQGQPDSLLLRGNDLAKAQAWADAHRSDLTDSETSFLQKSQEIAEEEQRARQAAERELKQQLELESAHKLAEAERQRAEEVERYARRLRRSLRLLIGAMLLAALAVVGILVVGAFAQAQTKAKEAAVTQATAAAQSAATQATAAFAAGATATQAYQAGATHDAAQATAAYQSGATATSANSTAAAQSTSAAQSQATAQAVAAQATADRGQALLLEQRAIEASNSLAKSSAENLISQPDLALLLAVEALRTYNTQQARTALQTGLLFNTTGETLFQRVEPFISVVLSPDGSKVAWGNKSGLVQVQQTANQKILALRLRGERPVRGLAFTRDGGVIAGVDETGLIRLWDTNQGSLRTSFGGLADIITLAFNETAAVARGSILAASGTSNGAIYLWDPFRNTNYQRDSLTTASGRRAVSSLAWSPDGSRLAAGDKGGALRIWSKDGWSNTAAPDLLPGPVLALAWSPDGQRLAYGGDDPKLGNTLLLWEVGKTDPGSARLLIGHASKVISAVFRPTDGKLLATGDALGIVRLWEADSGQPVGKPLTGLGGGIRSLAFSADGGWLYAVGGEGTVVRWNLTPLATGASPELLVELACQRVGRPGLTQAEWDRFFPTQNYRPTCGEAPNAPVAPATATPTPTAKPAP